MKGKPAIHLAALPFVVLMLATGSYAGSIGVYWGQNGAEGSLSKACSTGNYKIVNIGYLSTFGYNQSPKLNLDTHCSQYDGSCTSLSSEIAECQSYGVKVLLSIGGPCGDYALSSPSDASNVSEYLYNNFLGGTSDTRPFGNATLDGIDFNVDHHTNEYWSYLAMALSLYSTATKKVYLSASVACTYPDIDLDDAVKAGLFDHFTVRFYDNYNCLFNPNNVHKVYNSWNQWLNNAKTKQFYFGVVASPSSGSGFIAPVYLINDVLPLIKIPTEYSGVMIMSRFGDANSFYSNSIKQYV